MPIHFSIGFVTEPNPKRGYVAVCAMFLDDLQVNARYANVADEIKAVWPRKDNCK